MWFNESVHDAWRQAIRPAIEAAGYEPIRVDEVEHANRIDDEIISQIRRSKFLVCDLTGQRAGVYFEAGFGLGLGKQVIWTVHKDSLDLVHFDNRQYNFVVWNDNDYEKFQESLSARIIALLGPGETFSEKRTP
jgi:nucleoside 2-deoxyribosyltransferase